ncbi:TonB-dependent receptor [Lysobacter sp. LF1]|uniref:TonB-dependent receptor n=1 Tax=Lysobacter stagni TaxID=3045172 RepID=A0ABT6XI27_9GAMM|nr:TonB-dependent receptor [Lysobacter sp. LF1]MDI9239818.1 TonB-dependent receptor [Lysobacter sp. LF1]
MNQHRVRVAAIRRRSLSLAIVASLALAAPAFAQVAADAPVDDAAAPADAASDGSSPQRAHDLGAVMVTANKRVENIREVASSISVLGSEQLENIGATQMTDYASYLPGLQVQSNGSPGQSQVSMRGIAAMSSGSTVGTYIDETPIGSNGIYQQATLFALDLFPYDIDRIEVLRGPQGTLYGAGAMGGLLKYMTRRPDVSQTEFRIGGGVSDTEGAGDLGWNYRVGMNVPLVQDSLALRASYASNEIAGYVDNLVDGRKDINEGEQTSARAALLWQGDVASLEFSVMRQEIDSDNNAIIALDAETHEPIAGLSNYVYVDEPFEKNLDHYALTANWDLGFADFVSATGYSDTHTFIRTDQTLAYGEYTLLLGMPDPGSAYLDYTLDLKQITQEFRLTSKSGQAFEWMLGTFYSDEDGDNHQFVGLNQLDGTPLPGLRTLGELFIPSTYEETAVFANGSYRFNDRFKLGAGVRFSRNEQDFAQIVTDGLLLPIGRDENSSTENVFTWSITPQFQINKDVMVYAKAATGYQPGGPNVLVTGLPPVVDSSMLTSYEIGMKSAFSDDRVLFDLVGYQIDWEDIQVASQVNGVSGLVNGGEATSRGIEASLTLRPIEGLSLGLNAAYNDANLDEDFPTIIVPAGAAQVELNTGLKDDRMPYVPDLTWSLTADYYLPLGGDWSATFGGGVRWVDDRTNGTTQRQVVRLLDPPTVLDTEITEPLVIDSYYAVDLYAAFSNENWTLRAYMKNATDERAFSTMNDITSAVTGVTHHTAATPIQPRTFGLEVDYRF